MFLVRDPEMMLEAIEKFYVTNNETAHRRVENQEKELRFELAQTINEYMMAHGSLRRKMYQVGYPNITAEVITVRFIVNGLTGHPNKRDAARSLNLAGFVDRIEILQDRIQHAEF